MLGDKRLEFVQACVLGSSVLWAQQQTLDGTNTECELGSVLFFNRFTSQSYCKLAYFGDYLDSSKIMDLCLRARDLLMY